MRKKPLPGRKNKTKVLAGAVEALARHERARTESLSDSARSEIFRHVSQDAPAPRTGARLFTPWRQLALAGAAPVLLLVVMVGWLGPRGDRPTPEAMPAPDVQIAKVGDQVVFRIPNGTRVHFVSRSERPDRFEGVDAAKVVDGNYADRLHDEAGLVFYRID